MIKRIRNLSSELALVLLLDAWIDIIQRLIVLLASDVCKVTERRDNLSG